MGSLLDTILAANDLGSEVLDVPEWGVKLEVRGLTGDQRAQLLQPVTGGGGVDLRTMYWNCLLLGVFDPDTGEQVFLPQAKDQTMVKSGAVIERLATAVMRLSGMSSQDLGESTGDSGAIPSGGSPTN